MDGFQWNEIISRFPHIAEGIFEGLDDQSLTSCRLVEKSWKNVIDGRNYPWERIVKKRNLEWNGWNTYLHLASKYGHPEMFEKIFKEEIKKTHIKNIHEKIRCLQCGKMVGPGKMILPIEEQKNFKCEICAKDFLANPKNTYGETPFQIACEKGHVRIAEFIIKNSIENHINLNYPFWTRTGFHFACKNGHVELVELLIKNSVECNINLNAEDRTGRTGFHLACKNGHVKIVELLGGTYPPGLTNHSLEDLFL